jgi:hypothetical protein
LVLGAALLGVCAYNVYQLLSLKRMPMAVGRVVHSDAIQTQIGPEDYLYKLDIQVEFEVDGKRFTATSIGPDSAVSTSDRGWVDKILTRLQPPVEVPVRYRQDDPAKAIIDAGQQPGFWVLGIWGACALFAGGWMRLKPAESGKPGTT